MKKSLLLVGLVLGFTVLSFSADPQPNEAGRKAEQTACIACHSLRLIDSQRLSTPAWGREIDKMVGWGAIVPDRRVLIDYLAAQYGDSKPVPVPSLSGSGINPSASNRGNAK